jgi:hypothetical protein
VGSRRRGVAPRSRRGRCTRRPPSPYRAHRNSSRIPRRKALPPLPHTNQNRVAGRVQVAGMGEGARKLNEGTSQPMCVCRLRVSQALHTLCCRRRRRWTSRLLGSSHGERSRRSGAWRPWRQAVRASAVTLHGGCRSGSAWIERLDWPICREHPVDIPRKGDRAAERGVPYRQADSCVLTSCSDRGGFVGSPRRDPYESAHPR